MIVGCPRETKNHEYRVGLTPAGARTLAAAGHEVLVETGAGTRVGYPDADYLAAGARIAATPAEIYGRAELVIKVKEPLAPELPLLRPGQILYCYLHLAPAPDLLRHLLDSGVSCVAFETITDARGNLPLLAPMSRIAGRLAPQMGAWALQMANGGSGVLLGGVPGVPPAKVVVIGAGSVGTEATRIAVGMGADVTVLDIGTPRLEALDALYRGRIRTAVSDPDCLAREIEAADLVVGAALVPGRLSPRLVTRAHLRRMRPGSVLVDVGIDQGGIAETSRPTSHSEPLFTAEGIVHCCIPNMPSAVARTATQALALATLPHAIALADLGLREAVARDAGLLAGLQLHDGRVTHAGLATDAGLPYAAPFRSAANASFA